MENKISFTRTIGELQGDVNNHGDCFHYGSFSGCDSECPQLRRGECEVWKDNLHIICDDSELMKLYDINIVK